MATRTVPIVERFAAGNAQTISAKTVNVTFAVAFASIPKVVVTANDSDAGSRVWTTNVATTGFTINIQVNATTAFQWVALEF